MPFIARPPTATIDRDKEAYVAIEPHLALLIQDAIDVGWHETEVIAAIVGFAVNRAIEGAGLQGAEEFLSVVQEQLRQHRG